MRSVIAFQNNPAQQYVPVSALAFPAPPLLPGQYIVPSQPQPFPSRNFDKNVFTPMSVRTVYDYERVGKAQF